VVSECRLRPVDHQSAHTPPLGPGDSWASSGHVGHTQYIRSGDGYIAFRVLNSGTTDILLINDSVLPIEALNDNVHALSFLAKLGEFGRVIAFDRRGIGLSDPVTSGDQPSLDGWVADAVAVLDAVGSKRAALVASSPTGSLIALRLAADHPRRVSFLSVYDAIARFRWAPDYPWGVSAELDQQVDEQLRSAGGTPGLTDRRGRFAITAARHPGFVEWATTWLRRGAGPATVAAQLDVLRGADVRAALPKITCPTLVINHADVEDGRYIAANIANARYVELNDPCHLAFSSELDSVMAVAGEFANARPVEPTARRVLTTLLVTDIVDSPTGVAAIGDRRWGVEVDQHHDVVRDHLARFDGEEIKLRHDGFVARFDGPTRAVLCALAIRRQSEGQGITVRVGVHSGEVDVGGADVSGPGVHVAQRMCALAAGSQVLVTRSVVDLVADSELRFEHLGDHHVKGVRGRIGVFEASTSPRPLLEVVRPRTTETAHTAADARFDDLSPREREVLAALATGASNAEIATELFMSAATVKAHVSHLFVKLGCTNRVQLAILAHNADLAGQ
jgi:class 3 adenylate cyclase/DNA-binding CsgD family transcriptional regulator